MSTPEKSLTQIADSAMRPDAAHAYRTRYGVCKMLIAKLTATLELHATEAYQESTFGAAGQLYRLEHRLRASIEDLEACIEYRRKVDE